MVMGFHIFKDKFLLKMWDSFFIYIILDNNIITLYNVLYKVIILLEVKEEWKVSFYNIYKYRYSQYSHFIFILICTSIE